MLIANGIKRQKAATTLATDCPVTKEVGCCRNLISLEFIFYLLFVFFHSRFLKTILYNSSPVCVMKFIVFAPTYCKYINNR